MIEDGEVALRQAVAMATQPLVSRTQIEEHHERGGHLAQKAHHILKQFAGKPDHRHAGARGLHGEVLGPEVGKQFANDFGILVVAGLPLGHGVIAGKITSQFHGQISSGVRRLVTLIRSPRLRSFSACIWGR